MRVRIVPLFASIALLATPALAQTGTTETHQSSAMTGSANAASGQSLTKDTEQRIRKSLEQSGFKNVQVMPEAFVIRAEAPDGSRVMMQMSPDQFAEVVVPNGQSAANRNGTSSGSTGASSGSSGTTAGSAGTGSTSTGSADMGSTGTGSAGSGSTASPSNGSSSISAQSGSSTAQAGGDIAQQIRQSLQKNGFKDIAIMPQAFLIRGQAPDGSRMVMVVSPDEAEGIVAPGNGSGSAGRNGTTPRSHNGTTR